MKTKKYNINDININDQVMFKCLGVEDYDIYWTVVAKTDLYLEIEVKEMGQNDKIYLEPKYITHCLNQ